MNTTRWGESLTTKFVKLYLKHECLWNINHRAYKNRSDRMKAYLSVISEFKACGGANLTIPEVKIKIKNLRSTYAQVARRVIASDSEYEPKLAWFSEMDRCLGEAGLARKSSDSFEMSDTTQTEPEADSSSTMWLSMPETHDNTEDNKTTIILESLEEEDVLGDTETKEYSPKNETRLKRKKFKARTNSDGDDEFDIYGKLIASQLRQMDMHKALRLQLEIQSLVSEARMADL